MSQTTIGERLRHARESIPASLYQASRETKIRVDFLEAMESDNFRFLSGGMYVKGMLRAYGRWLGVSEDELAAEFDELFGKLNQAPIQKMIKEPAQAAPKSRTPQWIMAAGVAASMLLILSLIGVMNPVSKVAEPPAPPSAVRDGAAVPSSPATGPAVAAVPTGVHLTFTVIGDKCWLRVLADGAGNPVFEGNLFKGQSKTFDASEAIKVTIGNLGGVRVSLNGRDLGVPGAQDQFGTIEFTPNTSGFGRG